MKTLLKFLFTYGMLVAATILSGVIFSRMWGWFVVPVFPTMPQIDYMHGVGILSIVSFTMTAWFTSIMFEIAEIKAAAKGDEGAEVSGLRRAVIVLFIVYPVAFLGAYVWHCFIK